MTPYPPGPGLPEHAPSVKISTCFKNNSPLIQSVLIIQNIKIRTIDYNTLKRQLQPIIWYNSDNFGRCLNKFWNLYTIMQLKNRLRVLFYGNFKFLCIKLPLLCGLQALDFVFVMKISWHCSRICGKIKWKTMIG